MNADERRSDLDRITRRILGCVYRVSNKLGCGFLEKVYENALAIELFREELAFERQWPIKAFYDDLIVGEFTVDLFVENEILVELKATSALDEIHAAQCMNYLKASRRQVCLLINFGRPRAQIRRIVSGF